MSKKGGPEEALGQNHLKCTRARWGIAVWASNGAGCEDSNDGGGREGRMEKCHATELVGNIRGPHTAALAQPAGSARLMAVGA